MFLRCATVYNGDDPVANRLKIAKIHQHFEVPVFLIENAFLVVTVCLCVSDLQAPVMC